MPSRQTRSLALLGGLLAVLAAPAAGRADLIDLRLTNTGSSPISQTNFVLLPPGTLVPPVVDGVEQSPVSALPTSTGVGDTFVKLDTVVDPSGTPYDLLSLFFVPPADGSSAPGPLQPGGSFDFQLSVASPAAIDALKPTAADLVLTDITPSSPANPTPSPGTSGGGTTVPEPGALLLWASLAIAGLGAARLRRRPAVAAS